MLVLMENLKPGSWDEIFLLLTNVEKNQIALSSIQWDQRTFDIGVSQDKA